MRKRSLLSRFPTYKETEPAFWPVVPKVLTFITFMEHTVDDNRLRNERETVFTVENIATFSP